MFVPVRGGIGVPKGSGGETGLERRQANHDVVVRKPLECRVCSCHHCGGDERSYRGAGSVGAMHDSQELVGMLQVTYKDVPCTILEPVAKAGEEEGNWQHRVRRV